MAIEIFLELKPLLCPSRRNCLRKLVVSDGQLSEHIGSSLSMPLEPNLRIRHQTRIRRKTKLVLERRLGRKEEKRGKLGVMMLFKMSNADRDRP